MDNRNQCPKKCHLCGSNNIDTKIMDRIDYLVTEEEAYCKDCKMTVGYYAYGNWVDYIDITESLNN